MRRVLPQLVIAILMLAVASPVNAGYLVIRLILAGSGEGGAVAAGGSGGGFTTTGPRPSGIGPGIGGGLDGSGEDRPGSGAGSPATGGPAPHDPTRAVVVVVPVETDLSAASPFYRGVMKYDTNPNWKPKLQINYRNQKIITNLFTDGASIQLYDNLLQSPGPRATRATQVKDKYNAWLKSKTDALLLYDALTAALAAGLVNEALAYADELLAFSEQAKTALPPEIKAFAAAYKPMQPGLKAAATQPGSASEWQVKLDAPNVQIKGHYALITWDAASTEVERRLEMLEENFKGFFLWHATRGIELPVPDTALTVILPKRGRDVLPLARILDAPTSMPADGFYSVEHDLLVLSPERLDDVGQTFAKQTQQIYRDGVSREKLLSGLGPDIHKDGRDGKKRPEEVARMQTTALVERLVEDQATLCAISREGTRQLLYATNRLPRYVDLPQWLSNGAVNFFTRPKDPAIITGPDNKAYIHVAMTTGYGVPNYALQRYFRDLIEKQELNPDRAVLLKNILTDAYFNGLKDLREARDPDPAKVDTSGVSLHKGGQTAPLPGGQLPGGVGSRPPMGGGPPFGMGGFGMGGISTGTPPPMGPMGYGGSGLGGRPPGGGSFSGPPPGVGTGSMMGSPYPGAGNQSAGTTEEDDLPTQLRKKRARLSIKAQATAWSLYYYLALNYPRELQHFLDEVATLPRDLPLEGDTMVALFCKSFGLDESKPALARFTNGWLDYMRDIPPAGVDILLAEPKPATSGDNMGMGPGLPGGPGGGGGPPP